MERLQSQVDEQGRVVNNHETRIVVLEGLVAGMREDTRHILELIQKRENASTMRARDWIIIGAFALGFALLAWMLYIGAARA